MNRRPPTRVSRPRRAALTAVAGAAVTALSSVPAAHAIEPVVSLGLRLADTGGNTATVSHVGDVLTFELYARVYDGDGLANEAVGGVVAALSSGTGDLRGNLTTLSINPSFFSRQPGAERDIDLDGDLDIAGPNPNKAGEYFSVVALRDHVPSPVGGLVLGQFRFTVTDLSSPTTSINVNKVVPTNGAITKYYQVTSDGVIFPMLGGDPRVITADPILVSVVPAVGEHYTYQQWAVTGDTANTGASINANRITVAGTGAPTFRQAGGTTHAATAVDVGNASGQHGTVRHEGGALRSPLVTVNAGSVLHGGGDADYGALHVSPVAGATGIYEVAGTARATLSANSLVGGGAGAATLRVTGGSLTAGRALSVGNSSATKPAAGPATFSMSGGTASVGNLVVHPTGSVVQTGGRLETPRLDLHGGSVSVRDDGALQATNLVLRSAAAATLTLENGGRVDADFLLIEAVRSSGGTATVNLRPGGQLTVAGSVSLANRVDTGGVNSVIAQTGGLADVYMFEVSPRGRYDMSGGSIVVRKSFLNYGTVDLHNAPVSLVLAPNAFVDMANDRHWGLSPGVLRGTSNATITGGPGSLINFPAGFDPLTQVGRIDTQGLVHVAGQPLVIPASKSLGGSAEVTGDVTNEGLISPGNSPGLVAITGNLTQAPTGVLHIELAGTAADAYDRLTVSGAAALDGLLTVDLLDGFVPSPSDRFTFLTAGSLAGLFDHASPTLHLANGGGMFTLEYTGTSVSLTNFSPVPEPGTAGLALLAGSVGLAARRRRR